VAAGHPRSTASHRTTAATFGGVAVTLLAMPALAIYLTQQYDQLMSGCLKGREDFRATALCEVVSRSGTMALACATAWLTASPTWTGQQQAHRLGQPGP
ncbi:hypothetical protein FGX01_05685, partial [Xylella fastidiosa subsp. multiplex]|nr:hypothetical protein [Xylella fastidiosa subsp. multiplex]